jgi:CBS domain-containing protein
MAWASKTLGTPTNEVIAAVRTGITVESIATPRAMLVVRQRSDSPDFKDDAKLKDFDNVPVIEGDEIVGVYDQESGTLRDLSEAMFMASDASLLSFVENADKRRFAFLVRESQIVGIVTLSDIQKLPVYCVLYSLLMSVEMLLMECIRKECRDNPDKWMTKLNSKSKKSIEDYWKEAQQKNVALDRLSCASFGNELVAAKELGIVSTTDGAVLEQLNELRDLVCHGKEIALSPARALQIPALVRSALKIQGVLDRKLKGMPA